jgi:hypothetical protein
LRRGIHDGLKSRRKREIERKSVKTTKSKHRRPGELSKGDLGKK